MVINYLNHVAIIMDGNRRWAQQRRLPTLAGHRAGVESMRSTIEYLGNHHLKYLTIYGFSTENWKRASNEVEGLLRLFIDVLNKESLELNKRGVRLCHLGRLNELPPDVQLAINRAAELTKGNTGMTLNFAINYGGRLEIVDAVRRLIEEGRLFEPAMSRPQLDEKLFSSYLYASGIPDVDLLIRTGGEFRLSNFLLWQTAYSELYFTPVLWPDFDTKELEKALNEYNNRQRRFGGN